MATRVKARPDLHAEDLYAWSSAQAGLLRAGRFAYRDHGEDVFAEALPKTCPYRLDQVTGDWLPELWHGCALRS